MIAAILPIQGCEYVTVHCLPTRSGAMLLKCALRGLELQAKSAHSL